MKNRALKSGPLGEDEEAIDEVDHALPQCAVPCGARFGEGELGDRDVVAPRALPELERGPLALGESLVDIGADDRGNRGSRSLRGAP